MQKKTAKLPARTAKKKKPPVKKQDQKFSLKRLIMGEEKPDLTELEAGSTTVLDILSPTTIDTKSRDYIVVDGIFHAYLYVAGYGRTPLPWVPAGWLRWWKLGRASTSVLSSSASPKKRSCPRSPRPPWSTAPGCGTWATPARTSRSWTARLVPDST